VVQSYGRGRDRYPYWHEVNCAVDNDHVEIAGQNYSVSDDGFLVPTHKDQPAPDLRYFKPTGK
jgi:hypothetical protein